MAIDNPFDATAPKVDTGLVSGAMTPTPQVSGTDTASNVATVDPSQFTQQTPAGTAQAGTATGTGYTATNWNVDAPQTVNGQVNSILSQDNPLLQQARTRAAQTAASRGLLNSSMAVQAGEGAVLDKALQIATPDAATYAAAGKTNADAANSANQFTANAKNTADLTNANNTTDVNKLNATQENQLQSQQLGLVAQAQFGNAAAQNEATKTDATTGLQAQLANQDAAVKKSAQAYDSATKFALQNADAASKLQLQQIDASTRQSLADIEAKYKVQMQTSQSLAASYQSMVDNITKVMANPDLDAPAKQAAINNLTSLYNQGMQVQANVSGLNLGALLNAADFQSTATSGTSTTGAAAPVDSTGGNFVGDASSQGGGA